MRMNGTSTAALVLITAALGLTGCTAAGSTTATGPGSPTASASNSATSSASAPASTAVPVSAPATGPTPSGAPTTTAAAGGAPAVPACTGSQISVGDGQSGGAAGHIDIPITFLNFSDRTCTLYGFPGVAGLDSNDQQVVQAQRTTDGAMGVIPATTVTLAPGRSASAVIAAVDVPSGNATSCPSYPALLVTPPGTKQSTRVVLADVPGCQRLQIYPVVPGKTGFPS